jgi:hypothetical protein
MTDPAIRRGVRFVMDDYGFGMKLDGLGGPEIVYFARKPKDGFALDRYDQSEGLERSREDVRLRAGDLAGGQVKDARVAREAPSE